MSTPWHLIKCYARPGGRHGSTGVMTCVITCTMILLQDFALINKGEQISILFISLGTIMSSVMFVLMISNEKLYCLNFHIAANSGDFLGVRF